MRCDAARAAQVSVGNVVQGFAQSATVLQGTVTLGWQSHFHMEPQTVVATPVDDTGMDIVGMLPLCASFFNATMMRMMTRMLVLVLQAGCSTRR
jgi:xanthine dehydrogenase molybdopterin-binding subunit B